MADRVGKIVFEGEFEAGDLADEIRREVVAELLPLLKEIQKEAAASARALDGIDGDEMAAAARQADKLADELNDVTRAALRAEAATDRHSKALATESDRANELIALEARHNELLDDEKALSDKATESTKKLSVAKGQHTRAVNKYGAESEQAAEKLKRLEAVEKSHKKLLSDIEDQTAAVATAYGRLTTKQRQYTDALADSEAKFRARQVENRKLSEAAIEQQRKEAADFVAGEVKKRSESAKTAEQIRLDAEKEAAAWRKKAAEARKAGASYRTVYNDYGAAVAREVFADKKSAPGPQRKGVGVGNIRIGDDESFIGNRFQGGIGSANKAISRFIGKLILLPVALSAALPSLGVMGAAIGQIGVAALAVGPAAGAGIAALTTALGGLAEGADAFNEKFKEIDEARFKEIGELMAPMLDSVHTATAAIQKEFATQLVPTFEGIGQLYSNLTPSMTGITTAAADVANRIVGSLVRFSPQLENIANSSAKFVGAVGPGLDRLIATMVNVGDTSASEIPRIGEAFTGIFDQISLALTKSIESGQFQRVLANVAPILESLGRVMGTLISDVISLADQIGPSFAPLLDGVAELVHSLVPAMGSTGKAFIDMVTRLLPKLGEFMRELGPLTEALLPKIEVFLTGALDLLTDLGPSVTNLLIALLPLLQSVVEGVLAITEPLADLLETLTSMPGLVQAVAIAFAAWKISGAVIKPILDYLPLIGDMLRDIPGTARMAGGALKNFFMANRLGIGGIATGLGAAGAASESGVGQILGALGSIGGGALVGSMFGPVGTAVGAGVGAVIAGVSYFMGENARAAETAAAANDKLAQAVLRVKEANDLMAGGQKSATDALFASGGVVDGNVIAGVAAQLENLPQALGDKLRPDQIEDVAAAMKELNLTGEQLAQQVVGPQGVFDALSTKLKIMGPDGTALANALSGVRANVLNVADAARIANPVLQTLVDNMGPNGSLEQAKINLQTILESVPKGQSLELGMPNVQTLVDTLREAGAEIDIINGKPIVANPDEPSFIAVKDALRALGVDIDVLSDKTIKVNLDQAALATARGDMKAFFQEFGKLKVGVDILPGTIAPPPPNSIAPGDLGGLLGAPGAKGGAVYGGIPGRDSVPLLTMAGEHLLTRGDVAAMGGQRGVFAFRKALHSGFEGGGVIPGIEELLKKYGMDPKLARNPQALAALGAQMSLPASLPATASAGVAPAGQQLTDVVQGLAPGTVKPVLDAAAQRKQNLTDLTTGSQQAFQAMVTGTVNAAQNPVDTAVALAPLVSLPLSAWEGGETWKNTLQGITHWNEFASNPYGAFGGAATDIGSLLLPVGGKAPLPRRPAGIAEPVMDSRVLSDLHHYWTADTFDMFSGSLRQGFDDAMRRGYGGIDDVDILGLGDDLLPQNRRDAEALGGLSGLQEGALREYGRQLAAHAMATAPTTRMADRGMMMTPERLAEYMVGSSYDMPLSSWQMRNPKFGLENPARIASAYAGDPAMITELFRKRPKVMDWLNTRIADQRASGATEQVVMSLLPGARGTLVDQLKYRNEMGEFASGGSFQLQSAIKRGDITYLEFLQMALGPGRAGGGVLPGYSPGVDNMMVPMSGGEGVIIPEAMRALGSDWLYNLNSKYRSGISRRGYADGGVIPGEEGPSIIGLLTEIRDLLAGKGPSAAPLNGIATNTEPIPGIAASGGGLAGGGAGGAKTGPFGTPLTPRGDPLYEMAAAALKSLGAADVTQWIGTDPTLGGVGGVGGGGMATNNTALAAALKQFVATGQIGPDLQAMGLTPSSSVIGALDSAANRKKNPLGADAVSGLIDQILLGGGYAGSIDSSNKTVIAELDKLRKRELRNAGASTMQASQGIYGASYGIPASGGATVTGAAGLKPNTAQLLSVIQQAFPQIAEIGGVRDDPIPDHPTGHALDIMIPGYDTPEGKALGDQINGFLRANAAQLGIDSTIWQDQWADMAGNTSTVSGHMNHIHAKTNDEMTNPAGLVAGPGIASAGFTPGLAASTGAVTPVFVTNMPGGGANPFGGTLGLNPQQQAMGQDALKMAQPIVDAGVSATGDAAAGVATDIISAGMSLGLEDYQKRQPSAGLNQLVEERNPLAFATAAGFDVQDFTRQGGQGGDVMKNEGPGYDAKGRMFSDTEALMDRTMTDLQAQISAMREQLVDVLNQIRQYLSKEALEPVVASAVKSGIESLSGTVTSEIGRAIGQAAGPEIAAAVKSAIPSGGAAGSTNGAGALPVSIVSGLTGSLMAATGGGIRGPGTGTSDSILARLSNGEYVLPAADVKAMGGFRGVDAMRKSLPGFATGGGVIVNDTVGAEFFGVSQIPIIGAIVNLLVRVLLSVLGVEIEARDTLDEMSKNVRQFRGEFQAFDASGRMFNDTSGLIDRSSSSEQTVADERIRIMKIVIQALVKYIIEKVIVPIAKAVANAVIQAGASAAGAAINTQAPGAGGIAESFIGALGSAGVDIVAEIGTDFALALTQVGIDAFGEGLQDLFPGLMTGLFSGAGFENLIGGPLSALFGGMFGGIFGIFSTLLSGASLGSGLGGLGGGFFDDGGLATGIGLMPKATVEPERVLSPYQTSLHERLTAAMERGARAGGRGDVTLHAPITVVGGGVQAAEVARDKLLSLLGGGI